VLTVPGNAVNRADQLAQRIACNQAGSSGFRNFVLAALDPRAEDTVLDIGSGLGAQLLAVAPRVRRAVGIDVSAELVAALRARLTVPTARVVEGDMDALSTLDLGEPFTLAYAVYSLYYSRDPARLVCTLAERLHGPHARFVVVTPDIGNNEGWLADLGQLYDVPAGARDVAQLCHRVVLPAVRAAFPTVTSTTYADRVDYGTLDALMAYYDACAPYCRPDKREAALRYFGDKLARDGGYAIEKRSIALIGRP
jgi:SAM-dependent methyltransferase